MSAITAEGANARKWWAIGGSVVVLLAICGIAWFTFASSRSATTPTYVTSPANSQTLVVTVAADGVLQYASQTEVSPQVSGTVAHVDVEVGDHVESGDELFTMDVTDLETALAKSQGSVKQAEQGLAQAKQSEVQAQQSAAQAAQARTQAEVGILQAEQSLDAARSLPATSTGRAEKVELAQAQLEAAQAAMYSAKASESVAASSKLTAVASVSAAESSLETAKRDVAKAQSNLDAATVVAPSAGIITQVNVADGGQASAGAASSGAQTGGSASATGGSTTSGAAIVISAQTDYEVVVAVNEADRPMLEVGQSATVVVDATPDAELNAEVSWISPTSTSSSGVVSYEVRLRLIEQNEALGDGMTATADIVAETVESATVVPNAAVRVDGSEKYVERVEGGIARKTVVTTGASDDEFTQIVEGIDSGDEVVVDTAAAPKSGGMSPFGGN